MFSHVSSHSDPDRLRSGVLRYLAQFSHAVFLDSNTAANGPIPVTGVTYDWIAAAGVSEIFYPAKEPFLELNSFLKRQQTAGNWVFGHVCYDFKNEIEKLHSHHNPAMNFATLQFFVPEQLFIMKQGQLTIYNRTNNTAEILQAIHTSESEICSNQTSLRLVQLPSRDAYLKTIGTILHHISRGDIYEMNFCHQVAAEGVIDPVFIYEKLVTESPNPFAAFYKSDNKFLLCASPERYLKKSGNTVLSQPIKGTAARDADPVQDALNKNHLAKSEKERSENVMIVDLVRNDLSRHALPGSVKVDELFGVYTFRKVHQLISTVSCQVDKGTSFADLLQATFPMGSMTGAPKVRAMQIIEEAENFKRELYSGTIGYISPEGDFDFNVVIRSIFYDAEAHKIYLAAGGAITAASIPEKEFEETLIKLAPQLKVLNIPLSAIFSTEKEGRHA
ncbi:MAG: anthranilate synthase component I family protein [Bacteroidetes bacterium]|nr:anthranilate synthase component I family protein [Bacteroidota bacterium]